MNEFHPDQRYLDLAEKWLKGTITPEEEREYAEWYNRFDPDFTLVVPPETALDREKHRQKILQEIRNRMVPVIAVHKKSIPPWAAVAAMLLLMAGVFYFYNKNDRPKLVSVPPAGKSPLKNDIEPGSFGAVLTLSSGETIVLDTAKNGKLLKGAGKQVTKSEGNVRFHDIAAKDNPVIFYTLTTPRGRQERVTLPDGTALWLNAESSVKFPSVFTGNYREVQVTGEAYFEVTKDSSRPFLVNVNQSVIKVLGTHFNVMAYSNENAFETTLLEGIVLVSNKSSSIKLKPGQQSQLAPGNRLTLNGNVNLEQVVAWKNGLISFSNADLKSIMRQVERWYNIEVVFNGAVSDRKFSGDIPRNAKLSELLKLLTVNKIDFNIDSEQKKLTVMP